MNNNEKESFNLEQTVKRPQFVNEIEGGSLAVERNDIDFQGALIFTSKYNNVTIWYSYDGGSNETVPRLYGDDGGFNLTWDTPVIMSYDQVKTEEMNNGRGYYNYTLNVSSNFILFRAWLGEYEDALGIVNIISTGIRTKAYFLDEYYTQFDEINMNITLYRYNITEYGVQYRKFTEKGTNEFINKTISENLVGDDPKNVSISFNHSLDVGDEIEIVPFIKHYDNETAEMRFFYENKAYVIPIIDGNPIIELEVPKYTNYYNVSIKWNATSKTGNISQVDVDWGNGNVQTLANVSKHRVTYDYSDSGDGEYNITVTISAEEAVGNITEKVRIDTVLPEGSIKIKGYEEGDDFKIYNSKKKATVVFNGTDDFSGIDKFEISTDEGNTYEVLPNVSEHTIEFLNYGLHIITLTVYDKAGNTYFTSITIELVEPEIPRDTPVSFPFVLVSFISLVTFSIITRKKLNK